MRDFLVYSMANDVDIPVWIMELGTILLIIVGDWSQGALMGIWLSEE